VYDLEVEHCAFELHPGIPLEGQAVPWRPERVAAARSQFEQAADAAGLSHSPRTHWYNSVPAHEASLWADEQGRGDGFRRAVYRAYFVDTLNIAATDVLTGLAEGLGLAANDLRGVLADGRYRPAVDEQFNRARTMGITGVPAYVAGSYLMVGAQPYEVFCQLVEAAQTEETSQSAAT
jgi:predicted DsbA family dithiol-disulfide isomerase